MSRPFPSRSFHSREPLHRRNGKIRAREVRVIDEAKQQLGVMSLGDAIRLAQSRGLDLIEIAPNATPPVCRILEYGKFQYEESKRQKDSHTRQFASRMKELQLTPGIDAHDFAVKLSHAINFLCDDMKVRVRLRFRGRQRAHKEFGFDVVNRFIREAAAYGHADAPPKMMGDRDLSVTLTPLPRAKRARNPREGDAAGPRPAPDQDSAPHSPSDDGELPQPTTS
jgi:translation initiation factor IF-3